MNYNSIHYSSGISVNHVLDVIVTYLQFKLTDIFLI